MKGTHLYAIGLCLMTIPSCHKEAENKDNPPVAASPQQRAYFIALSKKLEQGEMLDIAAEYKIYKKEIHSNAAILKDTIFSWLGLFDSQANKAGFQYTVQPNTELYEDIVRLYPHLKPFMENHGSNGTKTSDLFFEHVKLKGQ